MRRSHRHLLVFGVALLGGWWLLRQVSAGGQLLPWNQGQAGSIFQGGNMGGGQ